jgi:hypothetical protein
MRKIFSILGTNLRMQTHSPSKLLTVLVFLLLALQVAEFMGIPIFSSQINDQEALKQALISDFEDKLPELITKEINFQIHELVMDKIKLSQTISNVANHELAKKQELILQVGSHKVNRKDYLKKFQEFTKKKAYAKLPRVDQKQEFLTHLKRHYSILEDCVQTGIADSPAYKDTLSKYRDSLFLTELLKSQISVITVEDIQAYYQQNKSLYEVGESFSFELLESKDQGFLTTITNEQKFLAVETGKQALVNQPESQVPYTFRKALGSVSTGELTPIVRYLEKFYLLKKTRDPQKIYTPLKQAASFIQERLTFQRIRDLLAKLANPLKFQFPVTKTKGTYQINEEPVDSSILERAKEILPPEFFKQVNQSPQELGLVQLELQLIIMKYNLEPQYFPAKVHEIVKRQSSNYAEVLMIQEKQKELQKKITANAQEVRIYYDSHKNQFVQSEGQLVSHIFMENRSKALETLNLALMDPSNFGQLAKERSEEKRTAARGGDMRYLGKEDITPEMQKIAARLGPGEVYSGLVSSAGNRGFHIIKFVKKVAGRIAGFEEVRKNLHKLILAEKRNRYLSEYMSEVIKKYPIRVDETLLAQL